MTTTRSTYEDFMRREATHGVAKGDRTGSGTTNVFGHQMRFPLQEGFPLVTTKKVHWKCIALEPMWFLRGDSHVKWLQERGVSIWDEWAREDGDPGPVYGVQWRSWPKPDGTHIDQTRAGGAAAEDQPGQPPHHRQRPERGGAGQDGADAVPHVLPVLRPRRPLELSALPAQRRHLPRHAAALRHSGHGSLVVL